MALEFYPVHLPPTTKIGSRQKHETIQDDIYYAVLAPSLALAGATFADRYGPHITTSFLDPSKELKTFEDLAAAQEGRIDPTYAKDLSDFVAEVQRDLGSIQIDAVIAIFDHQKTLQDLTYYASELGKRRVIHITGEQDAELGSYEVVALIEAKF